jgi:hypothetical protein
MLMNTFFLKNDTVFKMVQFISVCEFWIYLVAEFLHFFKGTGEVCARIKRNQN